MISRRTLKQDVRLSGRGLHSGSPVEVTISGGDQGIRFQHGGERVEALAENVTDTRRCTRLGGISTVEHLMSAFAGLEITDAHVSVTSPELPALDGSSAEYLVAMNEGGFESLPDKESKDLFTRVFVQEEAIKIAIAKGSGRWSYRYQTGDRWPHDMMFETEDVHAAYLTEIAPARTFALEEEIPHVLEAGLGQGLDESSVLILGHSGYTNPSRFIDEPARHKLLDLIGDLYLSGVPIRKLNVSAERSGHTANVRAARLLRQAVM